MKSTSTTTMTVSTPRPSALAALDLAAQRADEAVAAKQHAKTEQRRQAALADARAALEDWRTLEAEVRAWHAGDPLIREQELTPALARDVDAGLELRTTLEETVARHVACLSTWLTELDRLNPATGAARLEQIAAGITAQPVELAAVRRQKIAWYAVRKRAADALDAHARIIWGLVKQMRVAAALRKQAEAEVAPTSETPA
jgi:hypothetical protein